MKKILILGVSAVQADAIEFLKDNYSEMEVHAIAMSADGPGADLADYFAEVDILDLLNVEKYVLEHTIDLVYSVGSDIAMPVASLISEKLGLPHFISSQTAKTCNNKERQRNTLGKDYQGNVPYQSLTNIDQFDINVFGDYPLFLKPSDSQGQRGVKKVNSYSELKDNFKNSKSYSRSNLVIVEQYIDGVEVSVNGYMVNGVLRFCEISDRVTWPQYEGLIRKHVLPSEQSSIVEQKVHDILQTAAEKVSILNGPIYAQVKIEAESPYLIEVTPRLDGCHMWKVINESSDFNLLKLTFDHLLYDDVSELEKSFSPAKAVTLEFLCQEPNTKARYPEEFFADGDLSYQYYNDGDNIRPVNGKFEKIGYKIKKCEE